MKKILKNGTLISTCEEYLQQKAICDADRDKRLQNSMIEDFKSTGIMRIERFKSRHKRK